MYCCSAPCAFFQYLVLLRVRAEKIVQSVVVFEKAQEGRYGTSLLQWGTQYQGVEGRMT